ncbi:MAG: NAD-dependent epimerase/dehydratase family protein [Bacteroidota bacterium]|nr:NAD-dependent epimerase/dehydratase family protein [Bacteroidota bacterium]MDP4215549.1 NAD-dependent epimerase/dehydratase family protein [Bacteroidota bacterium]MDP4245179.1 NAD-dependent epimerase/dehydratase family protein [Bacteroidota bacterium]MDP4253874.1 NAD-dependent epimerase/dehydratase family protein [Bacteroidota bacterium]MDP4258235.1 NAD-dependent epimerase/dehydratase family protein [Bacteroidota bacterium]
MSIKTLVTGGTGFLGAYVIQELVEKGYRVRAIRRSDHSPFYIPASVLQQVEWIPGDLLDPAGLEEAMEGMDAVVHAAAKVSFTRKDRRAMFQTNIEGTANVVNAALSMGIRRFVHVSSVAALGRTENEETVTEQKKWVDSKLNTTYALSKYHGEMEVWRAMAEGLPGVIVNPGTILGYGDWNTSSCAIFKTAYGEFPWYSNGINGFVDVRDVARAIGRLLNEEVTGERYILTGDNWSFRQVFDGMADGFRKQRPSREATPFLSGLAWRMSKIRSLISGQPSLLTRESARVAQTSTRYDNSRILRQLPGFVFTPLQETIRQACEAYLKHLQTS